jgi:hypothetical protein
LLTAATPVRLQVGCQGDVMDNVKADTTIQADAMGGRSALPLVVPPVEFSEAAKPRAMRRKGSRSRWVVASLPR